jgi:RecA/RadA recombinase
MNRMKKKTEMENQISEAINEKPEKKKPSTIVFPTGCDLLNLVIGAGITEGYPAGCIINVVGDKSVGKSFIACELIAAAKHKYKELKWIYDDCESGFTFNTEYLYGVEIMPEDIQDRTRSRTVEQSYSNVRTFADSLKKKEMGIYVIDSLDGLTSQELEKRGDERYEKHKKGKEFDKGTYQMAKQKFLSQEFFPHIAELIERKNILLVIISQTRDEIGSFFKSQTRSGGKALDFYSHTALWLSVVTKIKKLDRVVGVTVKAFTKKSKTPRPYRSCTFNLIFDYGLDNIGTSVYFLFDLIGEDGKIKKSAANSIIWSGEEVTAKKVKDWMEEKKYYEEYRDWRTDKEKSSGLESMMEYIDFDEEKQKEFKAKFGETLTRDELISRIEIDSALKKELKQRVINKWEKIEAEVKSNRPKKYLEE